MSDSYPPYGGQPDPNATPWSGPPAQQSGYPAYGHPGQGQPAHLGAPFPPPPQKSNKGLIIGLSIGAAVILLLALCGAGIAFALAGGDDEPDPIASQSTPAEGGGESPQPGGENTPGPQESTPQEAPPNNNAVTARYSSDFSSVCDGSPILNAATYTSGGSGAKAYTFSNNPERLTTWSTRSVSSSKSYYARSTEFESVSVVGCLKFVEGSEGEPRKCDYKDSDDKPVSVSYISSRYTLTFHAAKTAEKIGDGGTVNAPANRCPSFISYNRTTMKAYAAPDAGSIEAALDKFLS
ncbi:MULTISPECIES: hypothetical protein [Micromonospora]|uniref:Uncharacterized protein n=1 Tax=Micromonospora yangpuensis TaxID=683228 RepID=A0A1C6U7V3_9ACTN|nr:hypothetical protein [Micromonospora yangpuensis]GGL89820.1 hypothetical protein GCM10012279_04360 [Micromonospora yangpuensis]SCL50097.1 hypothetical protein GA0070617_1381 [Micromonospora yangpuensis]